MKEIIEKSGNSFGCQNIERLKTRKPKSFMEVLPLVESVKRIAAEFADHE